MAEDRFDRDHHHMVGQLALDRHRLAKLGVADDDRLAADPERVGDARDDEDQPDIGIVKNVTEGIEAAVSQASPSARPLQP